MTIAAFGVWSTRRSKTFSFAQVCAVAYTPGYGSPLTPCADVKYEFLIAIQFGSYARGSSLQLEDLGSGVCGLKPHIHATIR